jgi:hypothetical protein
MTDHRPMDSDVIRGGGLGFHAVDETSYHNNRLLFLKIRKRNCRDLVAISVLITRAGYHSL